MLETQLVQKQSQKLKVTTKMIQSLNLLLKPSLELQTYLQSELERNPALEAQFDEDEIPYDDKSDSEEEILFDDVSDRGPSSPKEADSYQNFLEGAIEQKETLADHLIQQLPFLKLTERERSLATLLIYNLNGKGFHRENPENLVPATQLATLYRVMKRIQTLDPQGGCTTNSFEALAVQIGLDTHAPDRALEYLERLRDDELLSDIKKASKSMGLSVESIESIRRYLTTLEPYPGRNYGTADYEYIIPDLIVTRRGDKLTITLRQEQGVRLLLSPSFLELKKRAKSKEDKRYMGERIREASTLLAGVERRKKTILRVGEALLEEQKSFFLNGFKEMKPYSQGELANYLDLHESTVSRAISGKYIQTDWGLINIKKFFPKKLKTREGFISREFVKERISSLIRQQEGGRRLSDQKIADILGESGVKIARRTVAKYRSELINSAYK